MASALLGCGPERVESVPSDLEGEGETVTLGQRRDEIVNGTVVSPSYNPAVVRLRIFYNGSGAGVCTGSLVSARTVVTAAHCLRNATAVDVVFPNGTFRATRFRSHPHYNPNWDPYTDYSRVGSSDIAVLELPLNAPTSARIGLSGGPTAPGQYVYLMGYGDTHPQGSQVVNPSVGVGQVYQSFTRWFYTTGPTTACHGDSGGPVVDYNWQLLGVVNNGTPDCRTSFMLQFAAYRAWVLNNLF